MAEESKSDTGVTGLPAPPPLPARLTDPRWPVMIGSVAWFVAFCVLLVAHLGFGQPTGMPLWVTLSGWVLGVIGLAILAWQRAAARRGSRGAQIGA